MIIPTNSNLKTWASSLIVDFPQDNIPIFTDESDWKRWGNFLIQQPSFVRNACPPTTGYSSSLDWAMAIFKVMSI